MGNYHDRKALRTTETHEDEGGGTDQADCAWLLVAAHLGAGADGLF